MNVDAMERACWAAGHLDDRASASDQLPEGFEVDVANTPLCALALLWGFANIGVCFDRFEPVPMQTQETAARE